MYTFVTEKNASKEFGWHPVASCGITPKQNCIGTSIYLCMYLFLFIYFYYFCMYVCMYVQVHLNKLECRGKVHLFQ